MNRYAQLSGGVVANVIESANQPDAQSGVWVACGNAGPGWVYDGTTFAPPVPSATVPPTRFITQLAFLNRFTDAEAIGIDLASIGATTQAAGMRRYLNKVNAAEFIDLDRADTRAGVQALEAGGALAAGRALTILDAAVQSGERYRGR